MNKSLLVLAIAGTSLTACIATRLPTHTESVSIISNETDFSNWTAINAPASDWIIKKDSLKTSSKGIGYLRSPKIAGDYLLSFDAYSESPESVDIMLAATELPEKGSPYPDGVPIRLQKNKWVQYLIEAKNGQYRIFGDKKLIKTINASDKSAGFICFLKDGSPKTFANIRFSEFETQPADKQVQTAMDTRFHPLYNGDELNQWQMKPGHEGHWTASSWMIDYDGLSKEKDKCLWTKKSFRDFELIADIRLTREATAELSPVVLPNGDNALNQDGTVQQVLELYAGDTGIYLRGHSKNQINIGYRYLGSGEIYGYRVDKKMPPEVREAVTPKIKADNFPGQWNRFYIRLIKDRLTVQLNGMTIIDNAQLPGIAPEGPIALQDDHASNNRFQFANLFIREL